MFAVSAACNPDGNFPDEPCWWCLVFGTFQRINRSTDHAAIAQLGSVPLPVITARIDRFISEDGKGPYPDMERAGSGSGRR
jgi:hypothetical protein